MKAAQILNTLSTALLCALPTSIDAMRKVETRNLDVGEDEASRGLMHVLVDFKDECLHKPIDICIAAINANLKAFPEYFDNRPALNFEVNKIREATDEGYNIVSLRLNADEETVGGLLGDGMIWYPYEWCREQVGGVPTDCYIIGPWDCDIGLPLHPDECCNMIKDTVPAANFEGKYLECYNEYPVGSAHNPVDPGRVSIHTDAAGIVVNIPKNE